MFFQLPLLQYQTHYWNSASRNHCFAHLDQSQAKRIFDKHIEKSKINLAHLYACHLVKDGYVDCILTTNFDPLVIRTLSIYDIQPTIYDLTVSKDNVSSDLSYPAVVYLHGQNNGFWRLNSNSEFDIAKEAIGKTLSKVIMNRPMIIVGYSGNNDPVFEQLSAIDLFVDGLYWVTYKNHDPGDYVKEKLLNKHSKGAFCIKGYDADQFFRNLRNNLTKKLPDILNKPFTHLKGLIDNIAEIKVDDKHWEALVQVKENINAAITEYEQEPKESELTEKELLKLINEIWINSDYKKLNELDVRSLDKIIKSANPELIDAASSVFNNWGIALGKLAETKTGEEQEELYRSAFEKFEKALTIKPDMHEVFYNWGTYLGKLAETKTGEEQEELYRSAFEKFEKAIAIKPDYYEGFSNWGVYIMYLAKTKTGEEREELFRSAFEKLEKAIAIKPDYHGAFYNWACLYALQNKIDESLEYLTQAISLNKAGFFLCG